jgi:hypothetical protein
VLTSNRIISDPGVCLIKPFFSSSLMSSKNKLDHNVRVSAIFASKAGAYTHGAPHIAPL